MNTNDKTGHGSALATVSSTIQTINCRDRLKVKTPQPTQMLITQLQEGVITK